MTGLLLAAVVIGAIGIIIGVLLALPVRSLRLRLTEKEILCVQNFRATTVVVVVSRDVTVWLQQLRQAPAPVNGCPVGGAPVADKIAAIMGVESGSSEKKVAFVKCKGTCDKTNVKYNYYGITDCSMVTVAPGSGEKACAYGCMGYGSCVKACQFDAIHVVDGVAVVDKEKCVACGKCVATCPKGLIELVPYKAEHLVQCSSHDKGPAVKKVCTAGCIGCTLCTKQCEFDAIHMENNVAVIDYEKCTNCGKCAAKCPAKVIQ